MMIPPSNARERANVRQRIERRLNEARRADRRCGAKIVSGVLCLAIALGFYLNWSEIGEQVFEVQKAPRYLQ